MILNIADRIRYLRDKMGMTQTDLANRLGISRNAVNAWEMSTSTPTLTNIVELSRIFHVSTDYLLSLSDRLLLDISDLDRTEQEIVCKLVERFSEKKQ
ncbi:MAG: helix-turn-helix transcriptional regulator [Clostridia bacterium]|nr:helix-turn-helix transcriptional regulator [Clostridia bacterium]